MLHLGIAYSEGSGSESESELKENIVRWINVQSSYTLENLKTHVKKYIPAYYTDFSFFIDDDVKRSESDLNTKTLKQLNIFAGTTLEIYDNAMPSLLHISPSPEPYNYLYLRFLYDPNDDIITMAVPFEYTLMDLKVYVHDKLTGTYAFTFEIDDDVERTETDLKTKTLKELKIPQDTLFKVIYSLSDSKKSKTPPLIHQSDSGEFKTPKPSQFVVIASKSIPLIEFVIISSTFIISLIKFKHKKSFEKNAYIVEITLLIMIITTLMIQIWNETWSRGSVIHIIILLLFSTVFLVMNKAIIYQIRFAYFVISNIIPICYFYLSK